VNGRQNTERRLVDGAQLFGKKSAKEQAAAEKKAENGNLVVGRRMIGGKAELVGRA